MQSNSRVMPVIICTVAATFYIYDFLLRVMPSAMTHELMVAFHLNAGGFGILAALFFYGYAIMQIPSGFLYDRFDPRQVLITTTLLAALGISLFAATSNYVIAGFARLLIGVACAFAYTGALYVGSVCFAPRYFPSYAGLVQVLGCLGAIIGGAPIAVLTQRFGWQMSSFLMALFGIFLAVLMVVFIPRKIAVKHSVGRAQTKAIEKLRLIFQNRQNWWVALYGFSIWAPIAIFLVLWAVPFFENAYQVSPAVAASLTAICWIGIAVGGPIVGWWSSHIGRRKIPMIICSVIGFIASIYVIYLHAHNIFGLQVALFFFGAASSAQALSFGVAIDINPKKIVGMAIGFTNMAIISGGILLQPLVGIILESSWQGVVINGTHKYSLHAYLVALSITPLAYVLAFVTSTFLLKETYCKHAVL